ncbi:sulfite oxidase heme-binding subunit YedZ [Methylophaga sp. OBS1]|uniref:sulfite oxidase heme-binding subunit YedZ n=1 Tax=Methylophaga sp. OBS1 TaxID=2991933 RepID=UPI00224F28E3|nr:protein-methionine-sulfoxide reductase heme-binding subunit MsrQ [Methylophaga sp. OBS1]MCX4191522.1 sulfoxide reductase heme-binding subunit YedZ [Methylophaga sp. OBS1]MCX4191533.1 sulfoxide reductase heme-binding subunit YedZ [Methylophaga sp. OBS1]
MTLLSSIQAWTSNAISSKDKHKLIKVSHLKAGLFLLCLWPFVYMVWGFFSHQLGANPIDTVTRLSGLWALRFLLITLCVTPLRWLTGLNQLVRFRRMLGLFAFFYATVHMLLYLGLDQFFDWSEIWRDIIKRPFITVGFINFVALLPLVMTSTNKMVKRMGGRRWKKLHRLSYFVAAAACVHFLMLVKADIREPVVYIVILTGLLGVRLVHAARQKS